MIYGYLGTALGLAPKTLYIGGGAANHGENIMQMAYAVMFNPDLLYTAPNYGDEPNDHTNVERGINLYNSLFPRIIKSIPESERFFCLPWDKEGLFVSAESLQVFLRPNVFKDSPSNKREQLERLILDLQDYCRYRFLNPLKDFLRQRGWDI